MTILAPIPHGPHDMATTPSPDLIRAARRNAGLTGAAAAALIHCSDRTWRKWESGERKMHAAFWELFQIKATATSHRCNRK